MTDAPKEYPNDYDPDAVRIVEAMALPLTNASIVGSSSNPSMLFPGDYDVLSFTRFPSMVKAVSEFQRMVSNLAEIDDVFIGDIKIGHIPEWNIWDNYRLIPSQTLLGQIKIGNWSLEATLSKLGSLWEKKVISESDYQETARKIRDLGAEPDAAKFLRLVKDKRFHILRWTLPEIKAGSKLLLDKETISLKDAMGSSGLVKVDCVGIVSKNRFTDFSCIYEIAIGRAGKREKVITEEINPSKLLDGYKQSMYEKIALGEYFKATKRLYSIANYQQNTAVMEMVGGFLNSPIGLVYQVYSDVGTLLYLEENYDKLPKKKILYEIQMFRVRLTGFDKTYRNLKVNKTIKALLESKTKPKTVGYYTSLQNELGEILNSQALEFLKSLGQGERPTWRL